MFYSYVLKTEPATLADDMDVVSKGESSQRLLGSSEQLNGRVDGGLGLGTDSIRRETQKSPEIRSRSHSWDRMEAGFEHRWTGPLGKIQPAKQAEFPNQVQRGLEGRNQISNPGKFRAHHVADLFAAPTLVRGLLVES